MDGWVTVESVENTGRIETVYNLEVEGDHTYFVGASEWGFPVWAHNLYSDQSIPDGLTIRLKAAGVHDNAIDAIIKRGGDRDIPEALGDRWAARWTDPEIARLAAMTEDAGIDHVYHTLSAELYSPATAVERATHAAHQTFDSDLQVAGQAAIVVQDILVNFNKPVYERRVTHYGVSYKRIGEIDIETTTGIVEVTTQASAAGKVAQLGRLLSPDRNYFDGIVVIPHTNVSKPVLFYMPSLTSTTSRPARALVAAGAHSVHNTLTALELALRGL